jgi:uncharacterized protein YbjT (DUF2867 family)
MDVVVLGGHGKIGLRLLRLLSEDGHRARGIIRSPDQEQDLKDVGAEAIVVDVENKDLAEEHVAGADAVVMAAGAGPGSGPARKRTVDYGGAIKLIEAAKRFDVPRYLIVSAIRAGREPSEWPEGMEPYYEAKSEADQAVIESGLDYTIVRPGGLTDDPGSGEIAVAERLDGGSIPRDDVAAVLLACLEADESIGKAFDLVSGETPIVEAIRAL